MALSMVLLVGAGLTLRSFARLTKVDPGFDPSHVLTTQIALPAARYRDGASITRFVEELRRRTARLPGVSAASIAGDMPSTHAIVAVGTQGDPMAVAGAVRRAVLSIDPLQPVYSQQTLEQLVSDSMRDRRLMLLLLGIFATVALLLASVGIHGVISYSVEQRTREIGIRMALGAQRAAVLGMVVGLGARLAGMGIGIGLLGGPLSRA